MSSVLKEYWQESRKYFSRLPVWLPGTPLSLGDIGTLSDNGWLKISDLHSVGLPVSIDGSIGSPSDYNYSSGAAVSFGTSAAIEAKAAIGIEAAFSVEFERRGAFVLRARDVTVRRLVQLDILEKAIIKRFLRGDWPTNWVVVTEVAVGKDVMTLIADQAGARASVELGDAAPSGHQQLLNARMSAKLGYQRGLAASFLTSAESTVLWRGRYVNEGWLGLPRVKERSDSTEQGRRFAWSKPPTDLTADSPSLDELMRIDDVLDSDD